MKYAVIRLSGHQYKVQEGDKLKVDRLKCNKVETLLYVDGGEINLGMPGVSGVGVELKVIEEKKDKKIEIRRFRAKSRYRKKKGHRQPITILEVKKIGKGESKIINVTSALKPDGLIKEPAGLGQKKKAVKSNGIKDLGLSTRSVNALTEAGIKTETQLKKLTTEDLDKMKGLGEKSIKEILNKAKSK